MEDDFKLLIDELLVPVSPIYHKKDFNIRVHVFLAIIGLLFYRFLAWETKRYGLSLKELIDVLSGIRITLVNDNKSNKSEFVLEKMSAIQGSLFSFLNLGKFIHG